MPAPTTFVEKAQSLRNLLERARDRIAEVLPRHLTADRLLKTALIAANKNPALFDCSQASFVQSVMTAAELGLDCSGTLGSAYLVPYGKTCQLIIGYRGLMDLARRSGKISSITARVVREGDHFEVVEGVDATIIHRPNMAGTGTEKVTHVYAIARLPDGSVLFDWMTTAQVEKVRSRSRAGQSGPWVTDWDEMAKKTVVRRLCKYLPLSPEMESAMMQDTEEVIREADVIASVADAAGNAATPRDRGSELADLLEPDAPEDGAEDHGDAYEGPMDDFAKEEPR